MKVYVVERIRVVIGGCQSVDKVFLSKKEAQKYVKEQNKKIYETRLEYSYDEVELIGVIKK